MKTISFINLKGGVGKTTVALTTAYIFAVIHNLRVLIVDNDKQGNLTRRFGAADAAKTIADILRDEIPARAAVRETKYDNLSLIPADMGLLDANLTVLQDAEREQTGILKRAFADLQDDFDVCIIDNPPDINISVLNALAITDDVIAVTTPDRDSMDGVREMQNQIDIAREINPTLNFAGVLFNKYNGSSLDSAIKAEARKMFPVFDTSLRYTKYHVAKSADEYKTVIEVSPRCGFALDVKKFVLELATK